MSLVNAIPLPLFKRSARASAATARAVFPAMRFFSASALRRSPVLFIVLGAWEVLRRNRSKMLDLEGSVTRLSTKVTEDDTIIQDRDGQIAALEEEAVKHQTQEAQRSADIRDLKRMISEAKSQELALLQQITEGRESVAALRSRVEELEVGIGERDAAFKSLEDTLKEEVVKNLEMEDRRVVSAQKEEELERQLDVMRQTLAVNSESIVGMREIVAKLEGDCEEKEKVIGSLTRAAGERLQAEVDEAKAKEKEMQVLTERLQEYQGLVVERDALVFDLSSKVEELESNGAVIGDTPDQDPTPVLQTAAGKESDHLRLNDGMKDDYELKIRRLNNTIDLNRHSLKEKDDSIAELEGKLAGMEGERKEKEKKLKSLLNVSRKQEERLAEMEARVLVLTSTNEDLEDMRTEEKERFEKGVRALRSRLVDTNGSITKVEEKVEKLENEAEKKDAQVKLLSQAKEGLKARVVKRKKSLADLRAKLTAGQGAPAPSKPLKLHKGSRSKEEVLPARTSAQYEEKIVELEDKLAEAHRLLLNGPTSKLSAQSSLWPPPYEAATTSKNDCAHSIAAVSTSWFDSTLSLLLAPDRERFSAP